LPKTRKEAEELIKTHFSTITIPPNDVVEELAIQDEIEIKPSRNSSSSSSSKKGTKKKFDPTCTVVYSDALFKTNFTFYLLSGIFFFLLIVLPVLMSLDFQ